MKIFISKENEWFDKGSIAILISKPFGSSPESGIFLGTKNGELDEETCSFDEFEIFDLPHLKVY